jgi:hypothetical protein
MEARARSAALSQFIKVFLLLFLQKKKCFPSLRNRPFGPNVESSNPAAYIKLVQRKKV